MANNLSAEAQRVGDQIYELFMGVEQDFKSRLATAKTQEQVRSMYSGYVGEKGGLATAITMAFSGNLAAEVREVADRFEALLRQRAETLYVTAQERVKLLPKTAS